MFPSYSTATVLQAYIGKTAVASEEYFGLYVYYGYDRKEVPYQ